MQADYLRLYQQLGRLLEMAPDVSTYQACSQPAVLQWLGRGHALVKAVNVGAGYDAIAFTSAMDGLRTAGWSSAIAQIFQILYRAIGHCELQLPAGSGGSFIAVGNSFDAFTAVTKIFDDAKLDVLIVDPYLDQTALVDFGLAVPEGVHLRLLADTADHKATLKPAAEKWISQYGDRRPLSVRLAPAKSIHDRAIFIDQREAWTITQSLKDLAKRAPAEIIRADSIAALKVEAYEQIWATSVSLV
ncbi:hypothetical protein ACTJKQ_17990 [Acidovorax sp. 22279]|uniref:hypothetical protein n=1 Tax=Acidovorax sp. 22279 TaxID=3453900 RepID=UPI003F86890B